MFIDNKYAYVFSPYGIGDLVIVRGLKKSIEETYKVSVRFIVKPAHEFVMEMFGEKEYLTCTYSEAELKIMGEEVSEPTIGKVFVAHPFYHNNGSINVAFLEHRITFRSVFTKLFKLPDISKVELPYFFPKVKEEFQKRARIERMDNTVLLLPEMKSASQYENLPVNFFIEVINKIKAEGLQPIVNCTDDTYEELKPYSVEMTLEELVSLACECRQVISMRSGICDLIFSRINRLDIIYPNQAFWKLFNLKEIYCEDSLINSKEHVLSVSRVLKNMGYDSCAIYGYGNVGKRIHYSLNAERFPISYIVDCNKKEIKSSVNVYGMNDELPDVDVILITLSHEINDIKIKLSRKISGSVIDLHELLMNSDILQEISFI